jgi:hypothetical protein
MPSSRTKVRQAAAPQPDADTAGLKQGIRKWLFTVRPGGLTERSKGMTSRIIQDPPDKDAGACPDDAYEAPAIAYLGTLRELTLGGTTGPDDGVGGTGGTGSM